MAEVTDTDRNRAWQWLANGWRALRDAAESAVTYFTPSEQHDSTSQRWGVVAADVSDTDSTIVVELELPGMTKENLSVDVQNQRLIVSGEKRTSATRRDGAAVITERAYGRFQRVIPLPCAVAVEASKASYVDGVLTVKLPRQETPSPRQIPVGG